MNYAIILSGGIGTRLGLDMPKQYYEVNKKPIIRYVIETMEQCEVVDGFVIVAAEEWQEYVQNQNFLPEKFLGFALPGENRQLSIYNVQVSALLERKKVFAGQAPESFRFGKYLAANEALLPEKILKNNGSTEPAILAGMHIEMIPGDERNYKITTDVDLKKFIDEKMHC